MARSQYIYFVRYRQCNTLLGAFTVKREARIWATDYSGHPLESMKLSSMRDGVMDKIEQDIDWEQ